MDPLLDDILSEIQVSNWPYNKPPHPPSSLNDWSLPYTLHPKYLPTSITQSLLTFLIEYPLQVDPLSEDILWEIPLLPQSTHTHSLIPSLTPSFPPSLPHGRAFCV